MKILEVSPRHAPTPTGRFVHEPCGHDHSDGSTCSGRHWVEVSFRDYVGLPLAEATYKQIVGKIDKNFLDQGRRAIELRIINLNNIEPFDPDDPSIMQFDAVSSVYEDNNWTIYNCMVQFVEFEQVVNDLDFTPQEAAQMLLWVGNMKLHCTCPSLLFYYQWVMTQGDYAIYPEDRPPVRNNPAHKGAFCKHLNRVMHVLPFHLGDLARHIKEQRVERGLI